MAWTLEWFEVQSALLDEDEISSPPGYDQIWHCATFSGKEYYEVTVPASDVEK